MVSAEEILAFDAVLATVANMPRRKFLFWCELCKYYTDKRASIKLHEKAKHDVNGNTLRKSKTKK